MEKAQIIRRECLKKFHEKNKDQRMISDDYLEIIPDIAIDMNVAKYI